MAHLTRSKLPPRKNCVLGPGPAAAPLRAAPSPPAAPSRAVRLSFPIFLGSFTLWTLSAFVSAFRTQLESVLHSPWTLTRLLDRQTSALCTQVGLSGEPERTSHEESSRHSTEAS